jgi:hypothetical protein
MIATTGMIVSLYASHQIVNASVHAWVFFTAGYSKADNAVSKPNRDNGSTDNATQSNQKM